MEAEASRRTCIFCGGTPLTKEHVWPQWLSRFAANSNLHWVSAEEPDPVVRVRFNSEVDDVDDLDFYDDPKGRAKIMATHVVRAVCAQCNHGWMAALEGEVKPILIRQIQYREDNPSDSERLTLVRWLLKTTAVYEMDDPTSAALPVSVRKAIAAGDLANIGQWRIDSCWLPESAYTMGHGRAGLILDGEGGMTVIQIFWIGHAGYVAQYSPDGVDWFRPLTDLRRVPLWPQYAAWKNRPQAGFDAWMDLVEFGNLYDLEGPGL